jgi:hypothetical protein
VINILSSINGLFSMAMLNNQSVYLYILYISFLGGINTLWSLLSGNPWDTFRDLNFWADSVPHDDRWARCDINHHS